MAESAHTTNPSRRLFLAAGSAATVFSSLTAAAAALPEPEGPTDPMIPAIEAARRAHEELDRATKRVGQIETDHREIAFHQPRAQVGMRNAHGGGPFAPIYASSKEDIRYYALSRPEAEFESWMADRLAELEADRARNEADKQRIGLTAAEEEQDRASELLEDAEYLVLSTQPTTLEGAYALADYAARLARELHGEYCQITPALQNLSTFLKRA